MIFFFQIPDKRKTCLLIVFSKDKFPPSYIPTVFENYVSDIEVQGLLLNFEIRSSKFFIHNVQTFFCENFLFFWKFKSFFLNISFEDFHFF